MAARRQQGSGGPQHANRLDLSFLDGGFYNEQGIRPELLDEKALMLAKRFGPKGRFDRVSSAQMRKFFGDVRKLEEMMRDDEINLDSDKREDLRQYPAMIKMLKSKLAYAAGRKNVSRAFANTLSRAVDQVETPRDFKAFIYFFESIMGYYYGEGGGKLR
ncbi:MAG TPA: type III-A CRISPR-associated protein Csm2 [Desulfobulbus sp.]|nr:type III-A CRISPR-associated protein Csm2 [Desulfobulbus sp.]